MVFLVTFVACGIVAAGLTVAARRWALSASILDLPTARSSHTDPTPRGGGVAIVITTTAAVSIAAAAGYMADSGLYLTLVGGGLAVAAVSLVDDISDTSPILRAVVQFAAAGWLTYSVGPIQVIEIRGFTVDLGPAGTVLTVLAVVWTINLFNFMDGIDGFAASEAVVVIGVGSALSVAVGLSAVGLIGAAVAGATIGFLPWNWHPARIFLGDVGSSYLGFVVATLAVYSTPRAGLLVPWLIVGCVFWFDATATLIRRACHRKRWYEAHRQHAYQRLVQSGWSHAQTTAAALAVTVLLGALAWLSVAYDAPLPSALVALITVVSVYLWIERRRPMWGDDLPTSEG